MSGSGITTSYANIEGANLTSARTQNRRNRAKEFERCKASNLKVANLPRLVVIKVSARYRSAGDYSVSHP